MSNKTQLQTNNTKLDSLIELLKGKAVGGGSGGGVETVEITIRKTENLTPEAPGAHEPDVTAYYQTCIDGKVLLQEVTLLIGESATITVVKNSILGIVQYSDMSNYTIKDGDGLIAIAYGLVFSSTTVEDGGKIGIFKITGYVDVKFE